MLRTEQAAAGRVWLLLRALDEAGRGMVSLDDARAALTGRGSPLRLCGWRRLRQLLAAGEGVFWVREDGSRGAGRQGRRGERSHSDASFSPAPPLPRSPARLRLLGPARVAAALGVARLVNRPVGLPAAVLLGSIGDARAHLYAAFHSGRARYLVSAGEQGSAGAGVKRDMATPLAPPLPCSPAPLPSSPPISRATLAALSGACPRSQAAYERRAGVGARDNYALGERVPGGAAVPVGDTEQERAWRQGRALFRLTDHHGRQGAPGATYLAWRLPNTYGPARGHQQRPKGRQKRINRQLADLFTKGMTGNGRGTIEKRYFAGAAAAWRALEKRSLERRGAEEQGGRGGRGHLDASFSPAPLLPRTPASLHWPDGRTPSGAGVWRIVESAATK